MLKAKLKNRLHILRPYAICCVKLWIELKFRSCNCLRQYAPVREFLRLPSRETKMFSDQRASAGRDIKRSLEPEEDIEVPYPDTNLPTQYWALETQQSKRLDETFLATIHNGYVWGYEGGRYFDSERRMYWDLGTEKWLYYNHHKALTRFRFPRPQHLSGTIAVIAHRYADSNFGHWLFW